MCPNTPTKFDYLSQVWWPAGPMRRISPEHPKRCNKDYTHICVAPIEGVYEGLVYNTALKLSKYQKKNSASWIT